LEVEGTLEPGKLADLAVPSIDVLEAAPPEMPKARSLLTIVGGEIRA
jgi:predicted amidohydrolase YtcJ